MEPNISVQPQLTDPKSITERVLADARRAFANLPDDALQVAVEGAVSDLCSESVKVTNFIPVLAMRSVRESFERPSSEPESSVDTPT